MPVRRARFEALSPEHQHLNVEVDLGAIAPFDVPAAETSEDDLLHADLQTNAGVNYGVMLGSGRSGFYRERYLKGVGRTPLAGNWNRSRHVYHASGHLMASGAVRELVVSRYLQARGSGHTIVPCEGILLAPLDPRLAHFHEAAFPGHAPPPIDRHLQGLSVKPAGFARPSNLLWLLEHGSPHGLAGTFFGALATGLSPDDAGAGDSEPAAIAASFVRTIDRALGHFEAYLRAGVFWGSFYNNLTLDGRFLDLECAMIFGAPLFGTLEELPPGEGPRSFIGCEVLSYLIEMRRTLSHMRHRWRVLLDEGIVNHPLERDFVEEWLAALEDELPDDHALRGSSQACAAASAIAERVLDVPAAGRRHVRAAVAAHQAWLEGRAPAGAAELPLRPVPLSLSRSESVRRLAAFEADFLPPSDRAEAQRIQRGLDAIDAETTLAGVASALGSLLEEIGGPSLGSSLAD